MVKDDVKRGASAAGLLSRYNAPPMRRTSPPLDRRYLSLFLSLMGVLLPTGAVFPAGTPASPRDVTRAFRWPLPTVTDVQSSFGEYRYDHLHAGIDISTGGATGLRVLAA